MRKITLIMLIILAISLNSEIPKREHVFVISPTTGISTGLRVGIGFANFYEDRIWEYTLNYKKELISHVAEPKITFKRIDSSHYCSIYFQTNRFWSCEKKGSFFILKIGGFNSPPFSFSTDSGNNLSKGDKIIPLISLGYGYSFQIARKCYIRPSVDIGLQPNLINAGVAIIF